MRRPRSAGRMSVRSAAVASWTPGSTSRAGRRRAPKPIRQPRRVHGRRRAPQRAAAKDRAVAERAGAGAVELGDLVSGPQGTAGLDLRVLGAVLARGGRDVQPPGTEVVGVDALVLAEGLDA